MEDFVADDWEWGWEEEEGIGNCKREGKMALLGKIIQIAAHMPAYCSPRWEKSPS